MEQFDNATCVATEDNSFAEGTTTAIQETRVCSNCGAALMEGQKFCPNCGATAEKFPQKVICANCGTVVSSENKFCPVCGKQVGLPSDIVSNILIKEKKSNKKKIFIIVGVVAALVIIASLIASYFLFFVDKEIPVERIVLSEYKIELKKGETKSISCTVYPEDATDKTVTWISSDNSVASVSSLGMIIAEKKGTCTITVQSGDKTETIVVTVKPNVDLKKLYDDYCNSIWAKLGNDYSYLSVDSNPYDFDDGDYRYSFVANEAIEKINKALKLPDSLYEDMNHTTWSMGKQSETFEEAGVTVSWTYHPDKGLEVTYKLINN